MQAIQQKMLDFLRGHSTKTKKQKKGWGPTWSTSEKSKRLPLAVTCQFQPPTPQLQAARRTSSLFSFDFVGHAEREPGAQPGICIGEGEAVLEAGNNIKRSCPRFSLVFTQIESVFMPKFRWSPKKKSSPKLRLFFCSNVDDLKKKRGLHLRWDPVSLVHIISGSWPSLIPNTIGGLFSFLVQKSASKVLKIGYFGYTFQANGGA